LKLSDPSSLLPGLALQAEILIVRPRSLGDLVLETPVIGALHDWRPDLRIFVLVEKRFAAALEGNPAITGLLFSSGFLQTAAELRQRRFPVVFNQHGGPRSALLTAASGARFRVGWKGFQYDFVYNVRVPDAAEFCGKPIVHTVEHRISQFYWTGLPRGPLPAARVFPERSALDRVDKMVTCCGVAEPYAVLQPEARTPAMCWPAEKFAEIARWLRGRFAMRSVVNLSARGPATARIRAALADVAVIPDSLDLSELIALISRATLFIGNDSGPVHVAAALGTPAVVIYGPTNPVQWHPWQSPHRVVAAGTQFRAIRGDKSVPLNQPRSTSSISADEVCAACEELMEGKPSSKRENSFGSDFNQAQNA
jgi:heptosyltransferase III